ncbi:hypothetical protein P2318_24930 [Myxococcaceae bacterium GXIMD 01537]
MATALVLIGVATVGTQSMGFLRTTDVGALPELAPIQAQLLPLAACEINYGPRGNRHRYGSATNVKVTPCGGNTLDEVSVPVPKERQVSNVTFDMTRDSVSEPWKVLVEKESVAFPALKRSLEQLAPVLIEQYPVELQRDREREAERVRERKERQDAERARKEEAKNSYPQ